MNVWLVAAISLDGKIAQAPDQLSLDWTSKEDTKFFIEKTKEAGVMIMGRKTFETIGKPLPGREIVVMTCDPEKYPSVDGVIYTDNTPEEILGEYRTKGQESVVVAGGAGVYSMFIQKGLITDYFLTIEPVLFGGGVPLAEGFDRKNLTLVESRMLNDRAILLHYRA